MARTKSTKKNSKGSKLTHFLPNSPVKRPLRGDGSFASVPTQSKRKGKQVNSSQITSRQPVMVEDPGRLFLCFRNEQEVKNFNAHYAKVRVSCERKVKLDDFRPNRSKPIIPPLIFDWITSRKWESIIYSRNCFPFMVRELYYRDELVECPDGHYMLQSWVRGNSVHIDANTICEALSLPIVKTPQFPYTIDTQPNINDVLSELMGSPHTWGNLIRVGTGFLRPDYRVLYAIYHYCISPDSHHSETGSRDAVFLYAVGMGHTIDLVGFLFTKIVDCLTRRKECTETKTGLVLGSLISSILLSFWRVPSFTGETISRNSYGPYNLTSWKKSLSQASVYVRAKKDEDDAFI